MTTALVVGGSGPSGPHIVHGLRDRGFEVAVLHRGSHEPPELADFEHIHTDPHFKAPLEAALGDRRFDLAVVTYGRTRIVAEVLAGRVARFIGVGGSGVYAGNIEPDQVTPYGMRLLADENSDLARYSVGRDTKAAKFVSVMLETEESVLALHDSGAFAATWMRYPMLYGPRNVLPWEWSIIRRLEDGRPHVVLIDEGLYVRSRSSGINAAHCLLLAVDAGERAVGEVFNFAEETVLSMRQWVELVIRAAGGEDQMVTRSLPYALGQHVDPFIPYDGTTTPHNIVDTTKARTLLGYRDALTTEDAIRQSVEWYREHPVTAASHPAYGDRFDYELEDMLLERHARAVAEISADVRQRDEEFVHPYPHPDPETAGAEADQHGR